MKVLSVFGTRPEAIKMAPLVRCLSRQPQIESKVAVTAQHREMLDQVLQLFQITPDYDLNIMHSGQTLENITSLALRGLGQIIAEEKPDLLLVHGDTTTTLSGALAAFYQQVPCGHVEAGLRTADKYAPFPEEINRRLVGSLADFHFAPTAAARDNLLAENIPADKIFLTGNTVIDALLQTVEQECSLAGLGLDRLDWTKRVILLTCHRRENWGRPMEEIFAAVADTVREHSDVEVIFPVHKNPLVRQAAQEAFDTLSQVHLCQPLDYLPFCQVMKSCHLVLTDSGGLQEEAPALGKPVLVLREVTERPEAIAAGTARLIGTDYRRVREGVSLLLDDDKVYQSMAQAVNPYGDGRAAQYITDIILKKI
ncbi:MAG: UDP-N-acetylglucosamine 2-epimerase (non-hydrolyzing) [Clostridiales bacterium]|jgi:UDP-N-acetylglucosamine 2-epimerase (non-hydrolysing)|nr:UDP-N-acetylglucosamine 2-epimerase (non-hydrolyzing) [Clostridiales bacterium]